MFPLYNFIFVRKERRANITRGIFRSNKKHVVSFHVRKLKKFLKNMNYFLGVIYLFFSRFFFFRFPSFLDERVRFCSFSSFRMRNFLFFGFLPSREAHASYVIVEKIVSIKSGAIRRDEHEFALRKELMWDAVLYAMRCVYAFKKEG